eukprot:9845584-Karenia_brevis.AAC.1
MDRNWDRVVRAHTNIRSESFSARGNIDSATPGEVGARSQEGLNRSCRGEADCSKGHFAVYKPWVIYTGPGAAKVGVS